jgi:type IV pilus assembly protein PilO
MEITLAKLPWYGQVGAFVALAAAGVWSFYTYYEGPAQAEMASRQQQLTRIKADITKGLATAQKLERFRSEVADLEARLDHLKAVLPEEKDAAELLRSMHNVALESNLTIIGFKPSAPITQELHAEWPIALELEGSYHNLAIFLDRVGKFTRIVNISGLTIEGRDKPGSSDTVTAKCTATTFVLLDPAAAAAPDPKAKAKAKPGAKPAAPPKKAA